MAKQLKEKEDIVEETTPVKMKKVRNRGNCKLELYIGGQVVSIQPSQTIEVPADYIIQRGIGLFEV